MTQSTNCRLSLTYSPPAHPPSPPVGLSSVPRPDGVCDPSSMFWGGFPFSKRVPLPSSHASIPLVLVYPQEEWGRATKEPAITVTHNISTIKCVESKHVFSQKQEKSVGQTTKINKNLSNPNTL